MTKKKAFSVNMNFFCNVRSNCKAFLQFPSTDIFCCESDKQKTLDWNKQRKFSFFYARQGRNPVSRDVTSSNTLLYAENRLMFKMEQSFRIIEEISENNTAGFKHYFSSTRILDYRVFHLPEIIIRKTRNLCLFLWEHNKVIFQYRLLRT